MAGAALNVNVANIITEFMWSESCHDPPRGSLDAELTRWRARVAPTGPGGDCHRQDRGDDDDRTA